MTGPQPPSSDRTSEDSVLTDQLRSAIELLPTGFSIIDPTGRLVLCNRAYAAAYGVEPEAMIGTTQEDRFTRLRGRVRTLDGKPVKDGDADLDFLRERLTSADGDSVEVELENGEWWLITTRSTADGGKVRIRTDITRQKRAERNLRDSEELTRRVLEACPVPLRMTGIEEGTILYDNPATKALYGGPPPDGSNSVAGYYVTPADQEPWVAALRQHGFVDDYEVQLRHADGTPFWASLSGRLIEYKGKSVIVGTTKDLTDRLAIEEEMSRQREILNQNEKLSAMGELLAGVAHELNNPLSVVVGLAELLQEVAPEDERVSDIAMRLARAGGRCARIVKTFLAMARQEPAERSAVDINELIGAAVEVTDYASRSSGIDVTVDLCSDAPSVWGDASQLSQVLTNLIVNAQHALEESKDRRELHLTTSMSGHKSCKV